MTASIRTKEQIGKLINTMASDHTGRAYLVLNNAKTLEKLLSIAKMETSDSHLRQNLFGVLQKLSLRRECQSIMIKNGWVDYLLALLEDVDSLSEYSIEYSSALLMNLCLRTQGKKVCAQNPSKSLKILLELIEHDNVQVNIIID